MGIEDATAEFTLRQLDTFGAFSLIIIFAGAVIWWLLKNTSRQHAAFSKVIEEKDLAIVAEKKEKEKWQDLCFQEVRTNAESQAETLLRVTETITVLERMAGKGSSQ